MLGAPCHRRQIEADAWIVQDEFAARRAVIDHGDAVSADTDQKLMTLLVGVFAARRIGWGGRRAAYLSAVGFAIVLLNFVPISYFLTKSHNF